MLVVYAISIISTLPSALHSLLPLSPLPTRLRTLFSVGVHDIPTLSTGSRVSTPKEPLASEGQAYGWVACTTDDILAVKDHLYDTLITLPPTHSSQAKGKIWPRIQGRKAKQVKATQRDARRYQGLRRDLRSNRSTSAHSLSGGHFSTFDQPDTDENNSFDTAPLIPFSNTSSDRVLNDDASFTLDSSDHLLEPQSWSALAYNSFMWWASAGEKRSDLQEESEYDSALVPHLMRDGREVRRYSDSPSPVRTKPRSSTGKRDNAIEERVIVTGEGAAAAFEMALIGYFHRLSVLILKTLVEVVDAADKQDEEGYQDEQGEGEENVRVNGGYRDRALEDNDDTVRIESDDMTRMGLDIWSESDRVFVEELVEFYWGRRARVQGGRVECCGVRVC